MGGREGETRTEGSASGSTFGGPFAEVWGLSDCHGDETLLEKRGLLAPFAAGGI